MRFEATEIVCFFRARVCFTCLRSKAPTSTTGSFAATSGDPVFLRLFFISARHVSCLWDHCGECLRSTPQALALPAFEELNGIACLTAFRSCSTSFCECPEVGTSETKRSSLQWYGSLLAIADMLCEAFAPLVASPAQRMTILAAFIFLFPLAPVTGQPLARSSLARPIGTPCALDWTQSPTRAPICRRRFTSSTK